MDSEIRWMVFGALAFFGMLIGASLYSESQTHTEKMECMKLKGVYVGKGCILRDAKPQ
jgi:hypothetical protein